MRIVHAPPLNRNPLIASLGALILLIVMSTGAAAQSTDIGFPTPVRSTEINGTITPRDLGDPRLTRYFYSFTGTPGDLIVTVESRNLEGDVDVFTTGTLRPLAKVSMYAGGASSNGSKTIYLKNRESLILRVEARTPNDNEGSFRVRFSGAFEPIGSDVPDPVVVVPTVSSTSKTGRRVTSTGARIEEPEPQPTVVTKQPEITTPATPATETPAPAETPTTAKASKPAPSRPRTPRTGRTGRASTARSTRTRPATTPRRRPTPTEPAPASTEEAASGTRLIIELRDGMRVERFMTTVRRVTVENGQLIVITKDGKVERQPMSNVLRMAIEP
jgi:hypothetical protein